MYHGNPLSAVAFLTKVKIMGFEILTTLQSRSSTIWLLERIQKQFPSNGRRYYATQQDIIVIPQNALWWRFILGIRQVASLCYPPEESYPLCLILKVVRSLVRYLYFTKRKNRGRPFLHCKYKSTKIRRKNNALWTPFRNVKNSSAS